MTTQISTKLAALAVALMMNGVLIGGVVFVFSSEAGCPHSTWVEHAAVRVHAVV